MRFPFSTDQIRRFMAVQSGNPDLVQAQYRAFLRQIPLLYVIVLVSTWALAFNLRDSAPAWLSLYVPVVLTIGCAVRLYTWRSSFGETPTPEIAAKSLTRTNQLVWLLALLFSGWAMLLFPYGSAYERGHVAFYVAITAIGCIVCLMQLRQAAVAVAVVMNVAFIAFFGTSGEPTFFAMAANVALVSGAIITILMVTYRDFTRMVAARVHSEALSEENFRLANIDSLTGLPNRRQFFTRLQTEFDDARTHSRNVAVGIIDLDGFKPINDLHGHILGDMLLTEVANRLRLVGGAGLHVARLGGDEFAIIVAGCDDEELLLHGENFCAALKVPFTLDGTQIRISASIGFAVHPGLAVKAIDLFEHADYALYHGKRVQRGKATLFSADHAAAIHRDARVERALTMADLDQELSVLFQPIVDLDGDETVAFEALARWTSPELGTVSPAEFIPVAERSGMISQLTRVLLEKALVAAGTWPAPIRLSFNLSAKDIDSAEGVLRLVAVLSKSGFDPGRLDFEITETAMMHDLGQAGAAIGMLKALGCGISLDDFGTGYSSLRQLHALPLTKIKIDRSFVTDIHKKPASYKIVKSLLALSRDMQLGCVIEGVETEEELAVLRGLGCSLVQGYRFHRPLSHDAVTALLQDRVQDHGRLSLGMTG